jgi:replicative DNA helicase
MNPDLSNQHAELAFLGTVLRANPEQRTQMAVRAREEWFTAAERVMAWRVMVELIGKGLPVDAALLEDGMRVQGMSEGALRLVEELGRVIPTAGVWQELARRVEDYYVRRKGHERCEEAKKQFLDLSVPAMQVLESAESELFALHSASMGNRMRHIGESLAEALASIEESMRHRGHVTGGLACGFTDLDRMNLKGMRPGHVWIISAPPGGGKTVFLMKLIWNIATGTGDYREFNHPVAKCGVFSLEMSDVALAERILIRLAEIQLNKLDRGTLSDNEKAEIKRAAGKIMASQIFIEHCPCSTIQELRMKARHAVQRFGLQIIGVDYAQLIGSSSKDARGNRTQALMDVSLGLKQMAQECNVPVVVLAQPKQETWGNRAGLSALAETSQLAKDADLVGMLGFWDNLRLKESDEPVSNGGGAAKKTQGSEVGLHKDDPLAMAYLDVVKNRNGPNTEGKPPIMLKWEREWFDFLSTTDELLSGDKSKHQKR